MKEDVSFKDSFLIGIERKLEARDSTIDMAQETRFKWDSLFVFKPYTPVSEIWSVLGIEWEEAESTLISQSDKFNLLVFLNNKEVVSYSRIPRITADFSRLKSAGPYTYNESVFAISNDSIGVKSWIYLSQH